MAKWVQMNDIDLTSQQARVVRAPALRKIFLGGVAGTGKTTVGVNRLLHLLSTGVPAERFLVLVPQRTLAQAYHDALLQPGVPPGGTVEIATIGGLARRMIDLFWPLVAEEAGFGRPDERPVFLTLETAQYYMARVVRPLVESEGYFESITIDRNRLYSQIIDNLNKAAVVGFAPSQIAERLKSAWMGELAQARVYDQAQVCALRFRNYCLEHNLLDFSLQMSVLVDHLWQEPLCRDHLLQTFRHLIVDNVEEDTPVAHDLIYTWVAEADSALVIFDEGAGYRSFLGADPASARMLRDLCDDVYVLTRSFVMCPSMASLGGALADALRPVASQEGSAADGEMAIAPGAGDELEDAPAADGLSSAENADCREALRFQNHRYHPQMLDWVAEQIHDLIHTEDVRPGEIVVLAPFLTDALRFSLTHRLTQSGIPVRSHRPSRALRDEPATRTLLTLAALAHPGWGVIPSKFDVAQALMHAIADLDLVRAQLLAQIVYRSRDGQPELAPFDGIKADMQQRVTYVLGGRYEGLRNWLSAYAEAGEAPFDHFLARLFGEVLSQSGFGFHRDLDAGRVAATLIESVQKFRWIAPELPAGRSLGEEYLAMVRDGVIAAQYLQPWREVTGEAVLLAPAYTFLLNNRPVDVQFWLNVGGQGWWERLYQPLTHPYVLSRRWPGGKVWTDADEYALRQRTMGSLVLGLVRRCRRTIYLGLSELSEQGYEQEGALLRAVQRVLRGNRPGVTVLGYDE